MNSMEKYLIFYYLDKGFYSEVLTLTCKTSAQPELKLYESLVFVMVSQYVEAIRRLNEINTREGDVHMATLLLLIYSHKKCLSPDSRVISELEANLKQCQPCSNERALTLACVCLYFTRHSDKALGLAEKVLKLNSNAVDARLVMAWIEMEKNRTRQTHTNVNGLFRHVISLDPKCMNALLGDVATCSSRSDRLTKLNKILVQFPHIAPPLIERMELALASKDWQHCSELCDRLLGINKKNNFANKMKLLLLINVEGNYEDAVNLLNSCFESIVQQELPDPCSMLYDLARLFGRICGRNSSILSSTVAYMQYCTKQSPTSVVYMEELAYQSYLLGEFEEALRLYRVSIKLDDTSLSLLTGMTLCQFEVQGRAMNDQISQQLDLLTEISGKTPSPYIRLLQLNQLRPALVKPALDNIVRDIIKPLSDKSFGFQYLIDLNVDILLRVLAEYMKMDNAQESCIILLEHITSLCPGLLSASLLLAYLYSTGTETPAYDKAEKLLESLGETRPEYSVAQMLLSLVYIREEKFDKSSQRLELALSTDLKLIETPLYNTLRGLIEDRRGRISETVNSLRAARQLIHSKHGTQHNKSLENPLDLLSLKYRILHCLSPCDLCLLYQTLCSNLAKSKLDSASSELDKYIAEASALLKDTKYWIDLSLIVAEVKEKTDPRVALELLSRVPEQHVKYVQAMERMANVYLTSLKSPDKYIGCYHSLLNQDPCTHNYIRLAEAYLNVQDADKAVVTYEEAKRRNPDARFGVKLARIFVKTHQYDKAIGCYQESGPEEEEGQVELATLYLKLGQVEPALACLHKVQNVKLTAPVLAKIKERSKDVKGAYEVLKHALDTCCELETAHTYRQLAGYATQLRDFTPAIAFNRKLLGLELSPTEVAAVHLALTRLYMQINDWKSCEALCTQLLNSNNNNSSSNKTARLILADATFRRGDFSAAAEHFRSLLESSTSGVNYTALARYIEIQRRLATLSSGREDSFLEELLRVRASQSNQESGYYYCQGLLEWYKGNPVKALTQFHKAKHDAEWGTQSIHNMVEICLANPEVVGSKSGGTTAFELADTLMKEMNPTSSEEEYSCKLLTNFLRLALQDRIECEMALNEFTKLAQIECTRVGATLGLAKCYVSQNQSGRARNILKLLTKATWSFEEANYLESCWLLLAELYLQDNRLERAEDLINRSLSFNKSSTTSYELLASIAESRELYEAAASYYSQACKLQGSAVSVRQAYTSLLLKMKRYAECIDVCQSVTRQETCVTRDTQTYKRALQLLRT